MVKNWAAIVAVAQNGVIGQAGRIPWRVLKDRKWFNRAVCGQTLVVGRKTFETMGKPRPENMYLVLTRQTGYNVVGQNVKAINNLAQIADYETGEKRIWVCGGGEVYEQTLRDCAELFLTVIKKDYAGDVYFPDFKDYFELEQKVSEDEFMKILKFKNKSWER